MHCGRATPDSESRLENLPVQIENASPTGVRWRFVKTGGRLVKQARYCSLLLEEGHLTRRLFGAMARRQRAQSSFVTPGVKTG